MLNKRIYLLKTFYFYCRPDPVIIKIEKLKSFVKQLNIDIFIILSKPSTIFKILYFLTLLGYWQKALQQERTVLIKLF